MSQKTENWTFFEKKQGFYGVLLCCTPFVTFITRGVQLVISGVEGGISAVEGVTTVVEGSILVVEHVTSAVEWGISEVYTPVSDADGVAGLGLGFQPVQYGRAPCLEALVIAV